MCECRALLCQLSVARTSVAGSVLLEWPDSTQWSRRLGISNKDGVVQVGDIECRDLYSGDRKCHLGLHEPPGFESGNYRRRSLIACYQFWRFLWYSSLCQEQWAHGWDKSKSLLLTASSKPEGYFTLSSKIFQNLSFEQHRQFWLHK